MRERADAELLGAALRGEHAAVRALMARLTPVIHARVLRTLARYKGDGRDVRQEAEDLVQGVFEALLRDGARKLRAWDPDRGASLLSYAGLLAEREVISLLRSRKRNPFTEDPTEEVVLQRLCDTGYLPEHRAIEVDFLDKLVSRIEAELPGHVRDLFRRLYVDEQSPEEAQRALGLSRDAFYKRRARLLKAVNSLARDLASNGEPPRSTLTARDRIDGA